MDVASAETLRHWHLSPAAMVRELFDVTPDPWQEKALSRSGRRGSWRNLRAGTRNMGRRRTPEQVAMPSWRVDAMRTLQSNGPLVVRLASSVRSSSRGLLAFGRRLACGFMDFCCAAGRESCRGTDSWHDYAAAVSSLGIRTKLYAAAAKVNIQPTSTVPRCRVLRRPPAVLIQPNTSSMRLRPRRLTA